MTPRVGLYVRVSTKEQTAENQERELRQWADRLGFQVVKVYADTASGARSDRAELAALLAAAHKREFDTLLVWALDRISREGIRAMLGYLEDLPRAGVRVLSLREPWLDTSSPVWSLIVSVFAWVAQQERQRIGERVRAGQARAKAKGVRFGRKPRLVDLKELQRRRAAGQGWRQIARALRTPRSTLRRRFQEGHKSPAEVRPALPGSAGDCEGGEGRAAT